MKTASRTCGARAEPRLRPTQELSLMHAYWRACNYLAVGMIYLKDNPLLREPLKTEHVKHRLLGHWGASPALSFVWVHLNRLIVRDDLDVIFVAGPGHGAPGVLGPPISKARTPEIYPDKSQDAEGMQKFFKQFSFPGHIGSHVTPETPGSIHEGGELGYSLSHAYGMAFDNPDLIVACVVGDGEAETGPLATAWHSNKFLNPVRDGAVLPILNLNGYKIANPDGPRAHQPRGARSAVHRLRLHAVLRRRQRPGADASADGRDAGASDRRDSCAAASGARVEHVRPSTLAHDRAALAEGLDRTEGDQGTQGRRVLALASGALLRRAGQSREPEAARRLAAQLQARGVVRRRRQARAGAQGPGAEREPAHERQPARQRRAAAQGRSSCRTSATTRWTCPPGARRCTRTPSLSASTCATS